VTPARDVVDVRCEDLKVSFRSMASDIRFWVVDPGPDAGERTEQAQQVVEQVATTCTRFDPTSDLMRANAAGGRWTVVARECFDALAAAQEAHRVTGGLFDPRVLRVLASYGYDTSLPFETRRLDLPAAPAKVTRRRGFGSRTWRPKLDADRLAVRVGREPVDLGGIGKGLAVRWAAEILRDAGKAVLVEAGGDLMAIGSGTDGKGWMIAVENPVGGDEPTAVLRVHDRAVATSSTRIRSWTVGGTEVHHIIDPRTGRPAEADLASVTVVDEDPAMSEVWSKSLFVTGRAGIRAAADERDLAVLWVDRSGRVGTSRAMRPYVDWQVSRVA
jgi:thiamine biosynthesis lipoprotein